MSNIALNIEHIEQCQNGATTTSGYIVTIDNDSAAEEAHTLDDLKQLHAWLGNYIKRREAYEAQCAAIMADAEDTGMRS